MMNWDAFRAYGRSPAVCSLAAILMLTLLGPAQADPKNGVIGVISGGNPELGKTDAKTMCIVCHGAAGISPVQGFPDLAGQWPQYLLKQLHDFMSKKRDDPLAKGTMIDAVKTIHGQQEMEDLVAFFGSLPPPKAKPVPTGTQDKALWAAGKSIYFGGIRLTDVPACEACHSTTGAGTPPEFPRLAGQDKTYLVEQLTYFHDGTRANDPNGIMRDIAGRLDKQEILALATFIPTLSGGNPTTQLPHPTDDDSGD